MHLIVKSKVLWNPKLLLWLLLNEMAKHIYFNRHNEDPLIYVVEMSPIIIIIEYRMIVIFSKEYINQMLWIIYIVNFH